MKMPDLATTDSAVKVLGWRRQVGDAIRAGEILLDVETDKAAMEVEATVDGVLREIKFPAGTEVVTGDVLALIETAGVTAAAPLPAATAPLPPVAPASPPPARPAGGLFARNRQAREAPATIPLGPTARTAARRLTESKQQVPHFYLQSSAGAEALVARRAAAGADPPAWDAYFVRAVSRALAAFPRMACRFDQDRLVPADPSRIGVAVDLDGELFVVAIDVSGGRDVAALSQDLRAAVDALRRREPAAAALQPAAITISNLGGAGVESFAAIINPPEAAILAVGAVRRVAVAADGGTRAEWRVHLTLSVDHRVVNGLYAARFLAAIVAELEKP